MSDNAPVPIEELVLPQHPYLALKRAGIGTVEELTGKSAEDLLAIRHFGRSNLTLIRRYLGKEGLALRGESVPTWGKIHLDELNLPLKIRNCLHHNGGFEFAEQLTECTAQEIRFEQVGPATLRAIRIALGEKGLALKGEPVYVEFEYELDEIALALKKAGKPGIIAKRGHDGNSFLLQMEHEGRQLELRRPPAGSKWSPLVTLGHLSSKWRGTPYLPEVLEQLSGFAWELNGRSRIKSILTIKRLATTDERFQVQELMLENGESKGLTEHDLREFTFTGKHWILVTVPCEILHT